jgi:hypothetical protein
VELGPLLARMSKASKADEISLRALTRRWSKWFDELPADGLPIVESARALSAARGYETGRGQETQHPGQKLKLPVDAPDHFQLV